MTERKQVAGILITPETLVHPEKADFYIDRMAEHGYLLVDLFVRAMRHNLLTGGNVLHDCIAGLTDKIHARGMKCILDTDVWFWGNTFCEEFPDACQIICRNERVTVRNGKFGFFSPLPPMRPQAVFDRIEAVSEVRADGTFLRVPDSEYQYEWENGRGYRVEGEFPDGRSGNFVFTVGTKAFNVPDQSDERFNNAMKQILDFVRDIPLDGFGWDEPGKGNGNMEFFKAGRAFFERFKRNRGFALLDKMPYLDGADDTPEAVKIRCAYHAELNAMNCESQKIHNDYAEKIYGRKLFFGTHPTWSGIPCDLAGGVVDYFNLSKVLSAAWTDGSWTVDLRYYSFHMLLADGIRNELGFEDAYYNDWGLQHPVVESMHFAARFRMLFNVNWFNIFHSDYSEGIVNYRLPNTRTEADADLKNADRFASFVKGMRARSETAMLYAWESLAAQPKALVRAYYAAIGNTAHALIDSGFHSTLVSPESIRRGRVENGILKLGSGKFKVLILPGCYILDEDVYEKILSFAKAGVRIVSVGVPPMFTPEGKRLDYLSRSGIRDFSLSEYLRAFGETTGLPGVNEWEKEYYDFNYPAEPLSGETEIVRNRTGELICAGKNNLYFMSEFDPCEDLPEILRGMIGLPCEPYCDHAYFRIFESEKDGSKVVLCVAQGRMADGMAVPSRVMGDVLGTRRKKGFFRCLIRIDGLELRVTSGTWHAFRIENGHVTEEIGD